MRDEPMLTILLIIATVVVLVLVSIAIYYHWRLHQQRKQIVQKRQELVQERAAQKQRVLKSIEIICRALVSDQVTITEGCIRVSVLLRALDLSEQQLIVYSVFFDLESATAHIPILDDWRKLSRAQQNLFDNERESIEEKYRDFVVDAAQRFLAQGIPKLDNIPKASKI